MLRTLRQFQAANAQSVQNAVSAPFKWNAPATAQTRGALIPAGFPSAGRSAVQGMAVVSRRQRTAAPLVSAPSESAGTSVFPQAIDTFTALVNDSGTVALARDFNVLSAALRKIETVLQTVIRAAPGDLADRLDSEGNRSL